MKNCVRSMLIIGEATLKQNDLTGDWFVYGQLKPDGKSECNPYICENVSDAKTIARRINKYNPTVRK